MKKTIATITQILIFIGAWFVMAPDQLVDNTYIFGLVGSVELVKGNADWVMMTAGILSVFNIWVWWPKSPTRQSVEVAAAKSAEAKAKDPDPIVPKMD
jgi:hypothetical protein